MTMRILYFATLLLVALPAITSCNQSKTSDSEIPEGVYEFYGRIEPDEKIVMGITVDKDGKIEGDYKPMGGKDKGQTYNVQGSVFDKNKVTLYVTEGGGNQPVQTFNVFATKESPDVISFKGTINDNKTQKVSNVTLSTDKSLVDNLQAPSVESKEEKQSQEPKEKKEKKRRIENYSPYPIAPGNHKFNGKAEGQWPIVVYLTVSKDGDVWGKMAYKSTLKKYGDTYDHYLPLDGYFSGRSLHLTGEYAKGGVEEWDLDCSDNGSTYRLKGWAYSYNKEKYFSIDVKGE